MKTYSNQKKLAARLKVSAPRLSELMAESDWSFGKAPWSESQAAKIDAHLKARRSVNNATAGAVEETADDAAIAAMSKNPERVARTQTNLISDGFIHCCAGVPACQCARLE